jgi:hypothetical protein
LMIDRGECRASKDAFARFMANQLVTPSELYMERGSRFAEHRRGLAICHVSCVIRAQRVPAIRP